MRATWKGSVGFGLVMVPVRLYKATEAAETRTHWVHMADGGRVANKRVCQLCNSEVEWADLGKGIEMPDGSLSLITEEESEDLAAARGQQGAAKSCEVLHFTGESSLNPVQFAGSYYVEPDKGAEGAYVLLRDAMEATGLVGVCKFRLREKESLAVLRTDGEVMLLTVLLWPEEVRNPDFAFLHSTVHVASSQLEMAEQLVRSMEADFDPTAHRDEYRAALSDLAAAKATSLPPAIKVSRKAAEKAPDRLAAALEASLAAARKKSA